MKRLEKDACLNNLKLNLNLTCTSTKDRHQSQHRGEGVSHKRHRNKLLQGSLENVSSNPLGGEFVSQESTLRRTRSLAYCRDDVFTSLDIPTTAKRRSQLIPRAKLIDRTSFKDRCLPKARSHERLRSIEQHPAVARRKTTSSPPSEINSSKSSRTSQRESSLTHLRNPEKKGSFCNRINSFPTRQRGEIDSLDSNYQNKTATNSVCRVSEEDLSYSEVGLSLPNYYPDSKCDTDASLTDNFSVEDHLKESPKSSNRSVGENPIKNVKEQYLVGQLDSIPYDENIVLAKNIPLYDSLGDYSYYGQPPFKPRTIRGNTPYHRASSDYSEKPHSLPNYTIQTVTYDSDSSLSDYNLKYYDCENSKDIPANSPEYVESDTNFDEIKLSNDNIKLVHRDKVTENIIYDSKSEGSNIENNPIYDEISNASHIKEINCNTSASDRENKEDLTANDCDSKESISDTTSSVFRWLKSDNSGGTIKTSVRVHAADNELETSSEEYKTVVSIDTDDKASSCFSSKDNPQEKKHSHSYLREFLESQRGSKRPLQNYLSKKISRAFGDRNTKTASSVNTIKQPESNLPENQYHSLPDITIGKNLRKCEKIDRKLRKCDNVKITKAQTDSTNRFIVNIGRHFDLTAHSNIPVDFELKISKIPKGQKTKHKSKTEIKHSNDIPEKTFLEAVRTLKETLNGIDENQNITKPEIVAVKTKCGINEEITQISTKQKKESKNKTNRSSSLRSSNKKKINIEKKMEKEIKAINQEYQEKVGTIRNYWDKMAHEASEKYEEKKDDNQEDGSRCKIVDIQTKVDEVKKKFESHEESPQKQHHSKVQLAKELFEYKSRNETNGKMPNFIKECREIFENPYFERDSSNQFESLNPNIVEIINKEEREKNAISLIKNIDTDNSKMDPEAGNKSHKPVVKSKSITTEPEFDHVRYRVIKSDVFQKKIFANCDKESQFDGLMQYLQDYSFQELLIDNNIVIIEPIRSSIKYEPRKNAKTSRNITQLVHKTKNSDNRENIGAKRHFFYHPIRVNREVNDDELPNPDTVKQVRQFFECGLKKSHSSKDLEESGKSEQKEADPDKDRCSTTTDTNSTTSAMSDYGSNENLFESLDYCCDHYISEDALEKIREKGTTVTYYGGRILNKYNGKSISLTRTIMDEIRRNQKSNDCGCRKISDSRKGIIITEESRRNKNKDQYQGVRFKLLKSNSCSSRLELVGTKNLSEYRNRYLTKQKQLIDEHNKKKQEALKEIDQEPDFTEMTTINLQSNSEQKVSDCKVVNFVDKNALNENIKQQSEKRSNNQSPKIIGEEMKNAKSNEVSFIQTNGDKLSTTATANVTFAQPISVSYDYSLEKVRQKSQDEMEFEPYEVAS